MYDIILGRDESDKKIFGNEGLLFLGKGYVRMGQYTSLSNKIFMDVARSHVVLVAGKRGCLTGETLIFTDKGYKEIKYFDKKNDKVLSFNKEEKNFEWENAGLLEYPIKNEKLLQIELMDGRRINLTKEHPLLVNYGKYMFWRRAREIKEGDKIIVPLKLPEIKKDNESIRMARIMGFVFSNGTISKRKGKWKDGKGYWYNGTKSRLRIFCDDESVLSQAKKDLEEEFNKHVKSYKRNDCNCSVIQSLHANVINKVNSLGIPLGNKASIIEIPKIVWGSSNEFKRNFISALFSCDGTISKTGHQIEYYCKSRKFLDGLQILLNHFEIDSVIRENKAKCNGKNYLNYRLLISDNTSVENFKRIGFISKYKQERLDKHKFNGTRKRKTFYISKDLVCKKVSSIKELNDIDKVYDLSADKNHSFIANGIISHNSGKSYTLGVMAEEISNLPPDVSQNIASLIFDTMGIYWTMKFENEKDRKLLQDWNLKSKNLPVKIFVPFGHYDTFLEKGMPVDEKFALDITELNPEDWIITFGLDIINPVSIVIQRVLNQLKERGKFELSDIIHSIEKDEKTERETKNAAIGLFEAAEDWGIFARGKEKPTEIRDLVNAGMTSVLDLSVYNSIGAFNIRALVISLVCRKIFNQRMESRKKEEVESVSKGINISFVTEKKEDPLVWIFVDEAHEFLPLNSKTAATDALVQLLREGRQPGISLVLATQQPGQIHRDVMTQSDIVISHRVTSQPDLEALNYIMQNYLIQGISSYMNDLPSAKGSAIILDDNSERIYPVKIRPRFTWHGGEAPTAINYKKEI